MPSIHVPIKSTLPSKHTHVIKLHILVVINSDVKWQPAYLFENPEPKWETSNWKIFIILLCTYILIILLTPTDRKINNPAPRQPFPQHSNVSYSYSYMLIRRSWQVVTSPAVNHSSPVGQCGRVRRIPARPQTALYCDNVARSTADDAGKTDAMLMPGGRHFGFRYSLSNSSGIVTQ